MAGKVCILLFITAQAQIIFPGEVDPLSIISKPPRIKPTHHSHLVPTKVLFPDEVDTSFITRKPVVVTLPQRTNLAPPKAVHLTPTPTPRTVHRPPSFPAPGRRPPPPPPPHGALPSVFPSKCGEVKIHPTRIVGGEISEPGEWPWLAALGKKIGLIFINSCGGSLISVRHVLSAQHCFATPFKPDVVRLGEYDLKRSNDLTETRDFPIAQLHTSGYNPRTFENDIVLIVLAVEVVFSDYIQPICLPFPLRDHDFTGEHVVVAGWGKTNFREHDSYSDVPQHVEVQVVNMSSCAQSYSSVIDERHLCAAKEGKDACKGDSGGPLQYFGPTDGNYYLVGVVSYGIGCADAKYPGVYTRVTRFLDWIVGNM